MSDNILFSGYAKEKENYIEILKLSPKAEGGLKGRICIWSDKYIKE
ncbi:hypothetical protein J7M07_00125 [bacterium]|nr:hypothetical protein [bacterium]